MGNYASCFYVPQTAKLIDTQGKLQLVKLPITAAELILLDEQAAGHVVCLADDQLLRTRRFHPMKAVDQLSAGKAYVMVPVSKVYGVVSESTIALLESAFHCSRSKRRSSSKVLPALSEGSSRRNEDQDRVKVLHDDLDGAYSGFPCSLQSNYRQWRPVLEPIWEAA